MTSIQSEYVWKNIRTNLDLIQLSNNQQMVIDIHYSVIFGLFSSIIRTRSRTVSSQFDVCVVFENITWFIRMHSEDWNHTLLVCENEFVDFLNISYVLQANDTD